MSARTDDKASIFVSIASYRDSECQYTIQDLFSKAAVPERVVVGACLQVADEDEDCFRVSLDRWAHRIRISFLRHTDAKGPCYARSLIEKELFRDEDYYFQIDSHFRFVQDWDQNLLAQLKACPSYPRAILTSYASSYTLPKDYSPGGPDRAILSPAASASSILCAGGFGDPNRDDRFLRIKTRTCRKDFGETPMVSLFWTARFAFGPGAAIRQVPYDPYLEYIFFGEEIAMTIRLWTHGWDLYQPSVVLAYHLQSRAHRPWFREVQTTTERIEEESKAKRRIYGLLGMPEREANTDVPAPPEEPYGLGSARSLAAYERFAGIDFEKQHLEPRALYGGFGPDLFAPAWAEDAKEEMMNETQLRDVESWAGRGNVDAAARQFPELAGPARPSPEVEKTLELLRFRIGGLTSEAQRLGEAGHEAARVACNLGRSFLQLAQLESNARAASEAAARALQHMEAAASAQGDWEPELAATIAVGLAAAQLGLGRCDAAKSLLHEAAQSCADFLAAPGAGEEAEQLAAECLEHIHTAHERTDDRNGLRGHVSGVQALLKGLRVLAGDEPSVPMPIVSAAEAPPQGHVGVRARLLERAVLICVATGCPEDAEVARDIYRSFGIARSSPNLRRLLGMMQSSGLLL